MPVIISMLRGINLGPNNRIRMEALREVYTAEGMQSVQTFIQSGNVVFKTAARDMSRLSGRLEKAFEARFGFRAAAILRTLPELEQVIAESPFAGRDGIEPSKLLVVFLRTELGKDTRDAVERVSGGPEEVHAREREIFIYFPEGMGRSRLFGSVDKALGGPATARNWNTVTKLAEMGSTLL